MTAKQPEVLFDVAHGDVGASRQLRQALEVLRSATPDPAIRAKFDDVLAGRTSMRAFGLSDAFGAVLDGLPKHALEMNEDERDRLAPAGEAELERLRTETPADPLERVEEPEDDDYFSDRRDRGWLE